MDSNLMHNDKITRILPSNDEEQIFLTFLNDLFLDTKIQDVL